MFVCDYLPKSTPASRILFCTVEMHKKQASECHRGRSVCWLISMAWDQELRGVLTRFALIY